MYERTLREKITSRFTPSIIPYLEHPSSDLPKYPFLLSLHELFIDLQIALPNLNRGILIKAINNFSPQLAKHVDISIPLRSRFDNQFEYLNKINSYYKNLSGENLINLTKAMMQNTIVEILTLENSIRLLDGLARVVPKDVERTLNFMEKELKSYNILYPREDNSTHEKYLSQQYGIPFSYYYDNNDILTQDLYKEKYGLSLINFLEAIESPIEILGVQYKPSKYEKYLINLLYMKSFLIELGNPLILSNSLSLLLKNIKEEKAEKISLEDYLYNNLNLTEDYSTYFSQPFGLHEDIALLLRKIMESGRKIKPIGFYLEAINENIINMQKNQPWDSLDPKGQITHPSKLLFNLIRSKNLEFNKNTIELSNNFLKNISILYAMINTLLDEGMDSNILSQLLFKVKDNITEDLLYLTPDINSMTPIKNYQFNSIEDEPIPTIIIYFTTILTDIIEVLPNSKDVLASQLSIIASNIYSDNEFRLTFNQS